VRIPGDILFSTVRLTVLGSEPKQDSFGTGFLLEAVFEETKKMLLLISNRHVLKEDRHVVMNLHARERDVDSPVLGHVNRIQIARAVQGQVYVAHPDATVDLACLNLSNLYAIGRHYWRHITPAMFASFKEQELEVGLEVAFVGYPRGLFDGAHNLPLVRVGHIASVPVIDYDDSPEFVIDGHVHGGSSGSPVFTWIPDAAGGDPAFRFLGVLAEGGGQQAQPIGLGFVIKAPAVGQLIDAVLEKIQSGFAPQGGVELTELDDQQ
jgi:hypothetical protein